MNRNINFIFVLIVLALVFSFFLGDSVTARVIYNGEDGEEEIECEEPQPTCGGSSWAEVEYRCDSEECEGKILQRQRTCGYDCAWSEDCQCIDFEWDCGECQCDPTSCTSWSDGYPIKTCGEWQKCDNGAGWSKAEPLCVCAGECLEKPENPSLLNGEDKEVSTEDVVLPVKLNWDDVEHAQSYLVKTNGTLQEEVFNESEAIPASCSFKSNFTNAWETTPCCSVEGTNCKPWEDVDEWKFTTNLAPELVSPYDPDWEGPASTESVLVPITLDWCDVEEAEFYQLRIYLVQNKEKVCHPWMQTDKECKPLLLIPEEIEGNLLSQFIDEQGYFAKDTEYKWEVSTYILEKGVVNTCFSQIWDFNAVGTISTFFGLTSPPNDPEGNKPVGLPVILRWTVRHGVNSVVYKITPLGGGTEITGVTTASEIGFNYPQLSLNSFYKWKIWPCSDYEGKVCEKDYEGERYFKTTGQPPKLIYPSANATNIPIPINLSWQDVPGAKSYILKIQGDGLNLEKIVDKPELSLDYPDLKMLTNYSWQVKTCAWEDGKACGRYSNPQTFKTFKLASPLSPSPNDGGELLTDERYISWGEVLGAKAYQYKIKYISLATEEKDEKCPSLIGKEIIGPTKLVSANGVLILLECLGNYQWQVRACLDENCQEIGDWSNPWSFAFVESTEVKKTGGLVPCGRIVNDPNTPWNEREPCQFKHIFLLIKIIIDFLLFRVVPIVFILLTIATGVMFYFSISTGGTAPIVRVKRLWKSTGIGLGVIFFAWTIINIILKFVGYQIGIFGNWYNI